jgi:hypothetical protein
MSSLRLEGFDGGIRGHRSLIIGKESDWLAKINMLESESLYKGRSILVIQEPPRAPISAPVGQALLRKRWDCIFRVRDTFEAQMLATYVGNAPKPVRIVWVSIGTTEIPRALWQKWERSDITLLGANKTGEMMGCEWEVIFFPLQNTPQFTEKVLSMRGSGTRTLAANVSGHLTEIADNGAALVWSNIDETDNRGCLYWYDPSEGAASQKDGLTKTDAVSMLEELIGWVGKV